MFSPYEEVVCSSDCVTRNLLFPSHAFAKEMMQFSAQMNNGVCVWPYKSRELKSKKFLCGICDYLTLDINYFPFNDGVPSRSLSYTSESRVPFSPPPPQVSLWPLTYSITGFLLFLPGSMVPWDPSTRAHMRILSVRGLLRPDVAPRHSSWAHSSC